MAITDFIIGGARDVSGFNDKLEQRRRLAQSPQNMGAPRIPAYRPISSTLNIDKSALSALQSRALTEGPSPWQNLMLEREKQNLLGEQDLLRQSGDTLARQGMENIAMTGGLSSGASERLQGQGAEQTFANLQKSRAASAGRGMDIGIEDERQRMATLSQLPGMQLGMSQAEAAQANRAAEMANLYNLQRYGIESDIWGSQQLAQAQRKLAEDESGWDLF